MMILPLTEKGPEAKVRMAERIIDAAEKIGQKEVKSFVLSGLSIAATGYITEEQDRRILEVLKMTRIGEMIRKEIEEKVAESVAKSVAEGEGDLHRVGALGQQQRGFCCCAALRHHHG
jgi:molybdopterin synthase catalytic subunit